MLIHVHERQLKNTELSDRDWSCLEFNMFLFCSLNLFTSNRWRSSFNIIHSRFTIHSHTQILIQMHSMWRLTTALLLLLMPFVSFCSVFLFYFFFHNMYNQIWELLSAVKIEQNENKNIERRYELKIVSNWIKRNVRAIS